MRLVLACVIAALLVSATAVADGRCGPNTCRADVSVSGHAEPQPIRVGDVSEYKITAQNNGPDGALRIDLQVDVPAGLQFVDVQHFGGNSCTVSGTFVQCDLGDFASQQQAVVRIKVKGVKEGTFIAKAKVYASDVDDPNGGNGQVSATLLVNGKGGTSGAGVTGPSSAGGHIALNDPQRITRSGGVGMTVVPGTSGTMQAWGRVYIGRRVVSLVGVRRAGVSAGSSQRVFLGTTRAALSRIRAAVRGGHRLRTVVWARTGTETLRRQLYVRG